MACHSSFYPRIYANVCARTYAVDRTNTRANQRIDGNSAALSRSAAARTAYLLLCSWLILSSPNIVAASPYTSAICFDTGVTRTISSANSAEKQKLIRKIATIKSKNNKVRLDALLLILNIIKLYCGFVILREKIHSDTSTWQNLITNAGCGLIGLSAMLDGGTYFINICQALLGQKSTENFTDQRHVPFGSGKTPRTGKHLDLSHQEK